MKAIDCRNETFEGLRESLGDLRRRALDGWRAYGPGTTREVSLKCGMDLLTFRPRSTELLEAGLLEICGRVKSRPGRNCEGIYQATSAEGWGEWHARMFPKMEGRQQVLI